MTQAEHERLLELLSKQLMAAQKQEKWHLFERTSRLLYTMGAQVLLDEAELVGVLTPKR